MIYEKITRIKNIENELVRRKAGRLACYNKRKIHKKQLAFHRSPKANRWVFGGNRTGKTECGAVETVWLALGIHPYRKNRPDVSAWVVSLSTQVQRDVAQAKILSYLDKSRIAEIVMQSGSKQSAAYGVIDYIMVKNAFGGLSRIGFKSCEMGREKFSGASLDFIWFDEEPPEDIYRECRMRLLDRAGFMFGTMTPLKGLTFIYDEIYLNKSGDDEVWHTFFEWADNPYLKKSEIARLEATMSADELESRKFGRFFVGSGLIYPEFDENVHVIEPFSVPPQWQDTLSIDPGLNNPLSCHWYAQDGDGVVYVIAEHYEAKRDISYHALAIKEICARLSWQTDKFGRVEALIDSAANQRTLSGAKSVAELFFERGISVNTRVNKDLFSGINKVKAYLRPLDGAPKLYIFKNCVNLIREFKGYWWGEGEKPKKAEDHALDELRYYIASKPEAAWTAGNAGGGAVKTLVQRDKERLYRKISGWRKKM